MSVREISGLRASVQIALSLSVTQGRSSAALGALARLIEDHADVRVDLAAVGFEDGALDVTIIVGLGTLDDVKAGSAASRASVRFLQTLVHQLAACDPILVPMPDPRSPDSRRARELAAGFALDPAAVLSPVLA